MMTEESSAKLSAEESAAPRLLQHYSINLSLQGLLLSLLFLTEVVDGIDDKLLKLWLTPLSGIVSEREGESF